MPKVSVIIPTHNRAQYLSDAIESVLNQTYQDLEIIVVDDGSTDKTKEVVQKYQEKDSRICYFYKHNGGVASSCNFGIRKARGVYISFFEDDDISLPNRLEKQTEILDANEEISLAYSTLQIFNDYDSLGDIYAPSYKSLMSPRECFRTLIMSGCFVNNPSITFRKKICEYILYDESLSNYGLGHDFLFFLQASQKFVFYYSRIPLVLWRRGHNSLSSKHTDTFQAERAAIKKLYKNKKQIFGITYRQALSMMYVRQARIAIISQHLRNKYLFFLFFLVKAFLINPLNFAIYKTIIWTFTKRLWKKYRCQIKIEKPMTAANYLLSFRK